MIIRFIIYKQINTYDQRRSYKINLQDHMLQYMANLCEPLKHLKLIFLLNNYVNNKFKINLLDHQI